jgi:hypothetical protein
MLSELPRLVRSLLGYLLAIIAMVGETWTFLLCLVVIIRGLQYATELLVRINNSIA